MKGKKLREIGKARKEEYNQRKSLNFTVMLICTLLICTLVITLIALTAVMVKNNNEKNNLISQGDVAVNSTELEAGENNQDSVDKGTAESGETKYELDYIHIIKEGETLANIAYDIFGDAEASIQIADFNDLDDTDYIYIGQELKIPVIE